MRRAWARQALAFLTVVGVGLLVLSAAFAEVEVLDRWAREQGVGLGLVSLGCWVAAAVLAVQTYPVVRSPRVYALALLALPVGFVHFFHHANRDIPPAAASAAAAPGAPEPPGAPPAGAAGGPRRIKITTTVVGGAPKGAEKSASGPVADARPRGERAAASEPDVRRFVGLPDSVAKRYPDLPERLRRLFASLYTLSFAYLPLLVLIVTPLEVLAEGSRARLRLCSLGLFAGLVAALCWLAAGDGVLPTSLPAPAYAAVALGALALALVSWRSPGGLGGGVAGLLAFLLPVGLSAAGIDPQRDLGVDMKPLPPGPERVLILVFPLLLLGVVAREWVVSLSHTTQHDALTRIFNKAFAESIVRGEGAHLGSCFAVGLLDIDHFKKVNDTYGHGAGDDVLMAVAQAIDRTVHNRGLVCRTGGEEITVFFPGVDLAAARQVCDETRKAVEDLCVRTLDNDGRSIRLNVTLSAGVACNLGPKGELLHPNVQDVVTGADRALYAAKQGGRNRVAVDGQEPAPAEAAAGEQEPSR